MIQGEGSESSGSGENFHPSYLVDSEMAGPIKLKLGGMVEDEVTEVATTEIATTFKIWQTGNSYIRK